LLQKEIYTNKFDFKIDNDASQVLLRPSVRATLSNHRAVDTDNLPGQLNEIWRNAHRGGALSRDWIWLVVLNGKKVQPTRKAMRTTQQMISNARDQVRQVVEQKEIAVGPLEETYLSNTVARLPVQTVIVTTIMRRKLFFSLF
jgi:hypothetical protein